MILQKNMQERLAFLCRVVNREVEHLDYAANAVSGRLLTIDDVQQLNAKPELALCVEAFVSRFCRLQDTLGDKLLPALLKALGESESALLINLNKAEKFGWLNSAEQWMALRQLRNQMIHEYIEDAATLFNALVSAQNQIDALKGFAQNLLKEAEVLAS